jgi:hypothetical protein
MTTMTRKTTSIPLILLLWFGLVALACNLSTGEPPTLVPRASATPPPTLGYATLSVDQLPQQATVLPPGEMQLLNLLNQVDGDRLMLHVDSLQRLGTRHVNSAYDQLDWGIGAAYNYIIGQFEQIRAQSQNELVVFPQEFPVTWGGVDTVQRNIIAAIQGTEIGGGFIVIGAHYDSVTFDPEDGTSLAPGANDNASGVATLIELARILSTRPHRASIIFVAFSAEEIGRKGSIYFVDNYIRARNIDVKAMINLDIIGSRTGPDGSINDWQIRTFSAGPDLSPSRQLSRTLKFIGDNIAPNMTIEVQDADDRQRRYSDHLSFSEKNYAAVRFIEALEESQRQHTDQDVIADVQAVYLTRATQTVLAVATGLADGPRPPRNIVLRDNGNGTRTLVWEPIPDAVSYVVALRSPAWPYFNQQFEIAAPQTTVEGWDGFVSSRFMGVAIAAKDANGLMGPLSAEYVIP